jgi:hypothetical protein
MKCRNKVHIQSYILCCVYINTFCGYKDTDVEVLLSERRTYFGECFWSQCPVTALDPETINAQECRILKYLCTVINSKHIAMFMRTFIMLYNSTHPYVASTSQDSTQPGCFSVLFLCIEPLGNVLKVLDLGETKMSNQ